MIEAVTRMIETFMQVTADLEDSPATYFHTNKPPNISIRNYLKRLHEYMKCSEESFIMAVIYMDRLVCRESNIVINEKCIHRLFLSSLVVAAKFFDDKFYKNLHYSKVGGISNNEMNVLEIQFLLLIDFELFVSTEEFERFRETLREFL
jgi:hypothetical protein